MKAALDRLQDGLVSALGAHVDEAGAYLDPHTGLPSPSDHYGHCSVALAFACSNGIDWSRAMRPVRAWSAFTSGQIGHLPFNRLLLNLLRHVGHTHLAPEDDLTLIGAGIARCTLEPPYPSNNWSLLAQTCRLIEADAAGLAAARQAFCRLLAQWTTPAGGFIDYPKAPRPGGRVATPIAYHHKALFLVALAARLRPHPDVLAQLRRLSDWLMHCWDPAGFAGGLGRSNHALFGDACLIAALILLGHGNDDSADPITGLAQRIETQRRDDGLLWLNPAGPQSHDAAWDNYMHLSVYNAWMAAVVGIARQLGPISSDQLAEHGIEWRAERPGLFNDELAGLLCLRANNGMTLLMSTSGQPPQAFSRDEVELRYAGGVVMHLSDPDGALLVAPPARIEKKRLLENPSLAGWTPVFSSGGCLYGLTEFETVDVRKNTSGVSVRLTGRPIGLTRPTATGLWARIIGALDWRLLDGRLARRTALRRCVLDGIVAHIQIDVSSVPIEIVINLTLEIEEGVNAKYLNPRGYRIACHGMDDPGWCQIDASSSLPGARVGCSPPQRLTTRESRMRLTLRLQDRRWKIFA